MGLIEIFTVLFVGLKLAHTIDWSWWSVFAPMWIGYPTLLVLAMIAAVL